MTARERENARRRYERALLALWDAAPADVRATGADWYGAAYDAALELSARYSLPVRNVAGAIAALSPRTRWSENLADARALCDWYASGEYPGDTGDGERPLWDLRRELYAVNMVQVEKAARALDADTDPLDVLRGPKERAFYSNIMGDAEQVTVDVWITRAATRGALDTPGTARVYADVARAVKRAARRAGTSPRDLQAAVWVQVRGAAQ